MFAAWILISDFFIHKNNCKYFSKNYLADILFLRLLIQFNSFPDNLLHEFIFIWIDHNLILPKLSISVNSAYRKINLTLVLCCHNFNDQLIKCNGSYLCILSLFSLYENNSSSCRIPAIDFRSFTFCCVFSSSTEPREYRNSCIRINLLHYRIAAVQQKKISPLPRDICAVHWHDTLIDKIWNSWSDFIVGFI